MGMYLCIWVRATPGWQALTVTLVPETEGQAYHTAFNVVADREKFVIYIG